METKTVSDEVAELAHLYAFDKIGSTGLYHAFIAGYTAAQSEQSEMVKKSEVVEFITEAIKFYESEKTVFNNDRIEDRVYSLTEILTKLKDL